MSNQFNNVLLEQYLLYTWLFLLSTTGMYIAGVFKNMGESHFQDEVFLTSVGTYAALSNTLGRLTIGAVADKYGPIRTLSFLNIFFSVVLLTYAYTPYMGEVNCSRYFIFCVSCVHITYNRLLVFSLYCTGNVRHINVSNTIPVGRKLVHVSIRVHHFIW